MKFKRSIKEQKDNLNFIKEVLDKYHKRLKLVTSTIFHVYKRKGILYDQAVMYTGYTPGEGGKVKSEKTIFLFVNDHEKGSFVKLSKGDKEYVHYFENWKKWTIFFEKYFSTDDIIDMRFKRNEI